MWIQRGSVPEALDCSLAPASGVRAAHMPLRVQSRPGRDAASGIAGSFSRQQGASIPRARQMLPPISATQDDGRGGDPNKDGVPADNEASKGWFGAMKEKMVAFITKVTEEEDDPKASRVTESCIWDVIFASDDDRKAVYSAELYKSWDPEYYLLELLDIEFANKFRAYKERTGVRVLKLQEENQKEFAELFDELARRADSRYKGWGDAIRKRELISNIECVILNIHMQVNTAFTYIVDEDKLKAKLIWKSELVQRSEKKKGFGNVKAAKAVPEKERKGFGNVKVAKAPSEKKAGVKLVQAGVRDAVKEPLIYDALIASCKNRQIVDVDDPELIGRTADCFKSWDPNYYFLPHNEVKTMSRFFTFDRTVGGLEAYGLVDEQQSALAGLFDQAAQHVNPQYKGWGDAMRERETITTVECDIFRLHLVLNTDYTLQFIEQARSWDMPRLKLKVLADQQHEKKGFGNVKVAKAFPEKKEKKGTPASPGKEAQNTVLPSTELTGSASQLGGAASIDEVAEKGIAQSPVSHAEPDADSDAQSKHESEDEPEVHLEASAKDILQASLEAARKRLGRELTIFDVMIASLDSGVAKNNITLFERRELYKSWDLNFYRMPHDEVGVVKRFYGFGKGESLFTVETALPEQLVSFVNELDRVAEQYEPRYKEWADAIRQRKWICRYESEVLKYHLRYNTGLYVQLQGRKKLPKIVPKEEVSEDQVVQEKGFGRAKNKKKKEKKAFDPRKMPILFPADKTPARQLAVAARTDGVANDSNTQMSNPLAEEHVEGSAQEKAEVISQVGDRIAAGFYARCVGTFGAERADVMMRVIKQDKPEAAGQSEREDSLAAGDSLSVGEAATVSSADSLAAGDKLSADKAATAASVDGPVEDVTRQENSTRVADAGEAEGAGVSEEEVASSELQRDRESAKPIDYGGKPLKKNKPSTPADDEGKDSEQEVLFPNQNGWELLEAQELVTAAALSPTEDTAAERQDGWRERRQSENVDSDASTSKAAPSTADTVTLGEVDNDVTTEEAPSTAESAAEPLKGVDSNASTVHAAPSTAESAEERQGETVVSDASTSREHAPTAGRSGRTRRVRVARVAKPQGPLYTVHGREATAPRVWEVYEGRRPSDQWQPTWRSRSGTAGYIDSALKFPERLQWTAAGVLLYTFREQDDELLLLMGYSGNKSRLSYWNVLGGKRKSTDASAEATAVREMTEETGGLLSGYDIIQQQQMQKVLWVPSGKFALFLQQLPSSYLRLPERYAEMQNQIGPRPNTSDPTALAWVPLSDLRNEKKRHKFHHFLQAIKKETALQSWLERQQYERARYSAPAPSTRPFSGSESASAQSVPLQRRPLRRDDAATSDPAGSTSWPREVPLGERSSSGAQPASARWRQASNITPLPENELRRPNPPPPERASSAQVRLRGRRKSSGKEYKRDRVPDIEQSHDLAALEAKLAKPARGVVMSEVFNNGVSWNLPHLGTPSEPARLASSNRVAAIEAYPKAIKGTLRVFEMHQSRLRESIEDRRPRAYSGEKKAKVADTSALLTASLMSASASFLPTVTPAVKKFSKMEAAEFTSILFPASALESLPQARAVAPIRSDEEREREEAQVWQQPDNKALNHKYFLRKRSENTGGTGPYRSYSSSQSSEGRSYNGLQSRGNHSNGSTRSNGGSASGSRLRSPLDVVKSGDGTTWYGERSTKSSSPKSSGVTADGARLAGDRVSGDGARLSGDRVSGDSARLAGDKSSGDGARVAGDSNSQPLKPISGEGQSSSSSAKGGSQNAGAPKKLEGAVSGRRKVVVMKVGQGKRKPVRRKK